jgi:flagellar M-ring protein FliF
MTPGDVSVIDGAGVLVTGDDDNQSQNGNDRAAELRQNVTRILEARVGYGKAVVEIAVDTVTESEAITERKIDPQSKVAISSQNDEKTSSANNSGSSAVTVASNLPSGNAAGGGKTSQSNDSQTSEKVNYEVSETKREVVKTPGAIRRMTVAVLVDGVQVADANGQMQWQARPDEELAALRDLVAASVGYDETRGDVITLKSMAFEPVATTGTEASSSLLSAFPINVMSLVQLAVLAIVTLVLGLFVLRPILTARPTRAAALPAPATQQGQALTGVIEDADYNPDDRALVNRMPRASNTSVTDQDQLNDPVARLRRLISERQDESVEILRSWMDDTEEEEKA